MEISTFNGGLFDPARYPFLEAKSIGDARLLQALDLLTRVNRQFVDYRDLAQRHLGTIYEGLLEYHLAPLAAPGAAPVDGQVARSAEDSGFTVALVNSEGERHRTGSYYTPDFVVQYIVDHTLQPILDASVAVTTSDQAKIDAILAVNVVDPSMGTATSWWRRPITSPAT